MRACAAAPPPAAQDHGEIKGESRYEEKVMSEETILVTGAAGGIGSTGRVAIGILLEQGRRVRAMVRKRDARSDALRDLGAEVMVADMLDIVAVRAAMQGCSVLY